MCGKDKAFRTADRADRGSPPHVRERPADLSVWRREAGITPACAGKTLFHHRRSFRRRDHPRMCGKDRSPLLTIIRSPGSPPHVRERRPSSAFAASSSRITPACAGKTVMDPFIFALLRLPTFKIYLISLLNI